jgi:hypothetical protein
MICILHDSERLWYLAPLQESGHSPGVAVRDRHAVQSALRALTRTSRNVFAIRSLLSREAGMGGSAAGFTDQKVAAEAERLATIGRWILIRGITRPQSAGAAPRSPESEWVADNDDTTTSNDQGLDIRPDAELEEPLSLEIEVEEEPPFLLEIEDQTPAETEESVEEPAEEPAEQ